MPTSLVADPVATITPTIVARSMLRPRSSTIPLDQALRPTYRRVPPADRVLALAATVTAAITLTLAGLLTTVSDVAVVLCFAGAAGVIGIGILLLGPTSPADTGYDGRYSFDNGAPVPLVEARSELDSLGPRESLQLVGAPSAVVQLLDSAIRGYRDGTRTRVLLLITPAPDSVRESYDSSQLRVERIGDDLYALDHVAGLAAAGGFDLRFLYEVSLPTICLSDTGVLIALPLLSRRRRAHVGPWLKIDARTNPALYEDYYVDCQRLWEESRPFDPDEIKYRLTRGDQ